MLFSQNDKTPLPELKLNKLTKSIKKIDKHFNNQFGFKSEMVNIYSYFKNETLNENPFPNRVLAGKDGWYFIGNHYNKLIDDNFGNLDFTESELFVIKEFIQSFRTTLASRGVEFYIVVPPNKHRIYSEMLPYKLNQSPTRIETLNSYLKKEIDFEIIDLRDTLIANKNQEQLYYKTDTHWNDLGAFIGYQKTMNIIAPNLPKVSLSEYNIEKEIKKNGDITEMINIKKEENSIKLSKIDSSKVKPFKSTYQFMRFKNKNREKILVMYRDSFGEALIPFFNESFGETIYKRGYPIDLAFIDHKKPDIVIFEVVERNLSSILLNRKKSPN